MNDELPNIDSGRPPDTPDGRPSKDGETATAVWGFAKAIGIIFLVVCIYPRSMTHPKVREHGAAAEQFTITFMSKNRITLPTSPRLPRKVGCLWAAQNRRFLNGNPCS